MIHLQKDEKIILEIRKHWFVFFLEGFGLLIVAFLPIILFNFIGLPSFISITGDSSYLFVFLSSAWLMFIWVAFFVAWTSQYLDVWLITNKHIFDIEQISLFSRDVSVFRLERIEDVTIEVRGFLPTILGYGDIHIQTAGENRLLMLPKMPNPEKIREKIMKLHDEAIKQYST